MAHDNERAERMQQGEAGSPRPFFDARRAFVSGLLVTLLVISVSGTSNWGECNRSVIAFV